MNFDLKSTDIRKLPETNALAQQKETSMGPIETYWYTCLQQGNTLLMSRTAWLDTVKTQELHEDCIAYLNKLGYRRMPHLNAFFKKIREISPSDKFVRKLIGPDRQSATTLPSLQEARDYFDKITRTKHDWFSMDVNEDPDWNVKPKHTPDGEIPF
jgi:hypothetical protein